MLKIPVDGRHKEDARILSVNISLPKEIGFEGQRLKTGIFKEPVEGRIRLKTLNLDGDRQADLTVHGGSDKARGLS